MLKKGQRRIVNRTINDPQSFKTGLNPFEVMRTVRHEQQPIDLNSVTSSKQSVLKNKMVHEKEQAIESVIFRMVLCCNIYKVDNSILIYCRSYVLVSTSISESVYNSYI